MGRRRRKRVLKVLLNILTIGILPLVERRIRRKHGRTAGDAMKAVREGLSDDK